MHEALKDIIFCWLRFAANDLWAFLAGKQRIKFSLKGIIYLHFKRQMNSFHDKIRHIIHTSRNLLLRTPEFALNLQFRESV